MPFDTELTRALGIKVPVVQGGMQWVGYADIASAVSNAGGLGILSALTQPTPEDLRLEIRRCRSMTPNPFGVNITILPALQTPPYVAYAKVVVEEGVKVAETAGNHPAVIITMLKAAGVTVIHKCISIRHAKTAENLGADFVSIDGFEGAGHIGENDISNLVLLNRAWQSLQIPFIASGGFADGKGLAAALALGAQGISMGTRFLCTLEAPVHMDVKRQIVTAKETDTLLVLRRWRNTMRIYKNKVAVQALEMERESRTGKFEELALWVSGRGGREVFMHGDIDGGVWSVGQAAGLINDIPSVATLLNRIEFEAEATLRKCLACVEDRANQARL